MEDYDVPPERRAGLPAKVGFGYAVALFDNAPDSEGELGFRKGDMLRVLFMPVDRSGWWRCALDGREGLCPANRLRLLDTEDMADKSRAGPAKPNRESSMNSDYDFPKPRLLTVLAGTKEEDGAGADYDVPRPSRSVFAGDDLLNVPRRTMSRSPRNSRNFYEAERVPPNFSVFAGDHPGLSAASAAGGRVPSVDYDVPAPSSHRAAVSASASASDDYDDDVADRSMASLGSAFSSVSLSAASLRRSLLLGGGEGRGQSQSGGATAGTGLVSAHDRRLVTYVASGTDVVRADLLKARHVLAHSASAPRCKPPPQLVLDVKAVVLAAHRGVQLAGLLARRAESETLAEFASGLARDLMDAVRGAKNAAEDVERYFPSTPVVNEMVSQVDKVVGLVRDFSEVLVEISNVDEREK